jgi:hypothetical protein
MWAEALHLTALLPVWADALVFFAGLGLIRLSPAVRNAHGGDGTPREARDGRGV